MKYPFEKFDLQGYVHQGEKILLKKLKETFLLFGLYAHSSPIYSNRCGHGLAIYASIFSACGMTKQMTKNFPNHAIDTHILCFPTSKVKYTKLLCA